jgi:hypothetical protein
MQASISKCCDIQRCGKTSGTIITPARLASAIEHLMEACSHPEISAGASLYFVDARKPVAERTEPSLFDETTLDR